MEKLVPFLPKTNNNPTIPQKARFTPSPDFVEPPQKSSIFTGISSYSSFPPNHSISRPHLNPPPFSLFSAATGEHDHQLITSCFLVQQPPLHEPPLNHQTPSAIVPSTSLLNLSYTSATTFFGKLRYLSSSIRAQFSWVISPNTRSPYIHERVGQMEEDRVTIVFGLGAYTKRVMLIARFRLLGRFDPLLQRSF